MKYLMKNDDGSYSVGDLLKEDGIEFKPIRTFDNRWDAEEYYQDRNQEFTLVQNAHLVEPRFLDDIISLADKSRTRRDENASKASINVVCRSFYRDGSRHTQFQCYGSDCGTAFDFTGDVNSTTLFARQFWAEQNYLCGLADALWELGFTLCWDDTQKKHTIKGNKKKFVIVPEE